MNLSLRSVIYDSFIDYMQPVGKCDGLQELNADTLPSTDPMMIRRITPVSVVHIFGGVVMIDRYRVEDVGLAESRLNYDEPVVDCSHRILEITSLLGALEGRHCFTVFPSRRWRNFRVGHEITELPDSSKPLLYLGNPVRLFVQDHSVLVQRIPEFLIKSGAALGY